MAEGDTVTNVLKYISACSNHWSGVPRRERVISWIIKVVRGGGVREGDGVRGSGTWLFPTSHIRLL